MERGVVQEEREEERKGSDATATRWKATQYVIMATAITKNNHHKQQ